MNNLSKVILMINLFPCPDYMDEKVITRIGSFPNEFEYYYLYYNCDYMHAYHWFYRICSIVGVDNTLFIMLHE